jgi:signal peptidase I
MNSLALSYEMPDDDLYIGPTVLAPGVPEGPGIGHRIATKVLIPLAVVFVAVVLVFYVFYQRGRVLGPSMLPTLHSGDMVLLTKDYPEPHRGDIVFTQVIEEGQPVEIVKRVIGLPGDTVQIKEDVAVVNGIPEPSRGQVVRPEFAVSVEEYRIPAGFLYLMGDNRTESADSRYTGPAPLTGVMGRVVAIYAPINRVGTVH